MGRDGGIEVTHKAVKDAKIDLEEVLKILSPDPKDRKATPVFSQSGPIQQLLQDPAAIGGFWPAAQGFQTSVRNAGSAVGNSYVEITTQLTNAIGLLKVALTRLETAEKAGTEHAGQAQV
ncbi:MULTISPECIES: hypothetical protein [Streptosporangium]|uniref:ESX-1 secretion-associated protein n=1 Tax=Streptosporangium brasiliense TaxID=47480 RepID=A0ABT9R883_9ACTN|nr:hypothetical protein [Streptosporangium brasiliense]MDP9865454.1 hypothetical protein [Streptosporangium brasiliense]